MSKPGIFTKARIVEAVVENNGDQPIGEKYYVATDPGF